MKVYRQNHGDQKTRSIQRVRVRRDRRPSVICAAATDSLPSSRRSGTTGRNGLEIAPARGETAGQLSAYQPNTRRTWDAEIVNRRGPQRGIHRNRMATVKKQKGAILRGHSLSEKGIASPPRSFVIVSVLRENNGSSSVRREKRNTGSPANRPLSVCRGMGQKSAILQFRPRHGAEGINTKMERSKQ